MTLKVLFVLYLSRNDVKICNNISKDGVDIIDYLISVTSPCTKYKLPRRE